MAASNKRLLNLLHGLRQKFQFLHEHRSHRIVFGELDEFLLEDDAINWM